MPTVSGTPNDFIFRYMARYTRNEVLLARVKTGVIRTVLCGEIAMVALFW